MFGVLSILSFGAATGFDLANYSQGVWNGPTFVALGLFLLAVHVVTGWLPFRNPGQ